MPWPNAINLQDPPSRDDFLSHFWFRRFLVDGFSVAHGVSWGVLQSCGIPKSTWVSILNCLRWMIWEYSPILGNLHMRDWDHCKVSTFHCVLKCPHALYMDFPCQSAAVGRCRHQLHHGFVHLNMIEYGWLFAYTVVSAWEWLRNIPIDILVIPIFLL